MKVNKIVKLHLEAGKATPAPPIGPALAPHGINISQFCQEFNEKSKDKMGYKLPVVISIFEDRSFKFVIKTPLTSQLIKKEVGIEKGSSEPNKKKVGKITQAQLKKIAQVKLPDLNTKDLDQAAKVIAGTAKNMGLEIS